MARERAVQRALATQRPTDLRPSNDMQPLDYAIAKLSDSDDIARLLAQVFSESDPPAVAMALSFEEMEQFLQVVVPNVIPDGLTVIARSKETGKVAGVYAV